MSKHNMLLICYRFSGKSEMLDAFKLQKRSHSQTGIIRFARLKSLSLHWALRGAESTTVFQLFALRDLLMIMITLINVILHSQYNWALHALSSVGWNTSCIFILNGPNVTFISKRPQNLHAHLRALKAQNCVIPNSNQNNADTSSLHHNSFLNQRTINQKYPPIKNDTW